MFGTKLLFCHVGCEGETLEAGGLGDTREHLRRKYTDSCERGTDYAEKVDSVDGKNKPVEGDRRNRWREGIEQLTYIYICAAHALFP